MHVKCKKKLEQQNTHGTTFTATICIAHKTAVQCAVTWQHYHQNFGNNAYFAKSTTCAR